jgi:hypothetical protein
MKCKIVAASFATFSHMHFTQILLIQSLGMREESVCRSTALVVTVR